MNLPDDSWHPADPSLRRGLVSDWQELDVLLVEDDAGDALLVEELVSECRPRMRLHVSRSLAEALTAIDAYRPHCVLLDLNLPDSHGLDALAALVKAWLGGEPTTQATPAPAPADVPANATVTAPKTKARAPQSPRKTGARLAKKASTPSK